MEQKDFLKNISGTVCVVGLALSTMSLNSTMVVDGSYKIPNANYSFYNYGDNSSNPYNVSNNIYVESNATTKLEAEAKMLFGTMRDATQEEQEGINNYIKSISKDTGVNFFDLC